MPKALNELAFLAICVACAAGGCKRDLSASDAAWFEKQKERLGIIASYELGCPASSLEIKTLGPKVTKASVSGCGKHTAYVYDSEDNQWEHDPEARRD